ncbi:MAG: endonuclease [Bacteroidota bacterium]|nr:endonuclease [Bacteroidota bacterium]MDX5430501.1 endonuclease [Bacteroidota bacterium]MDX5469257.1 endonuclease [Bacteroidota bacterium]
MNKASAILLFLFCTFFYQNISGQKLRLSADSIHFGTHQKWEHDSLLVWLVNEQNTPLLLEDVNVSGWDFHFTGDTANTVKAGDSLALWVHFIPRHNIEYNGELALYIAGRGVWRVDLRGTGTYPGTYYSSTFNLSEEALKSALKTKLAQGYVSFGYNGARDWIYMSIDNEKTNGGGASVNTLYTAYTGRKVEGYLNRQDAQTNGNLNTEHTYPQSKFGSAEPMQSDMFHLFVVDAGANSRRSNYPFSVVQNPSWTEGGAKYGGGFFEPRDEQKGNTARAMLYFVTRYQNYDNFLNAAVTDENGNLITQEALMRKWAVSFPPTAKDSIRNEAIFSLQKNRNPFIDHPEFLERIQFVGQNSVAPQIRSFETHIPEGTVLAFSATAGDTIEYQLGITNTGNQLLPVSISTKNGTQLNLSSGLFNVAAGETQLITLKMHRTQAESIRDSLIIKSSAIPGLTKTYALAVDFFNVGLKPLETSIFMLYPNPCSGRFSVQLVEGEYGNLEIYSNQGALVHSAELIQPLSEISTSELSPGLYFVRVIQGHQQSAQSLVVR